jgi:HEAT repeat protein
MRRAWIVVLVVLVALGALGAPPSSAPDLRSPDPAERFAAVVLLDRAGMRQDLERLLEMARHDPDERVRREVVRELGWSRDPRVLPVLDELLARGELLEEAAQSLAIYGPAGCARLRAQPLPEVQGAWRRALCLSAR